MDFKQIEAYVNVIEYASFSKAADAIFMSQPSVSTYVSNLEKELAATLINRSTKEVSPTAAGKIFYEKAKEILALKHNTMEQIKGLTGSFSGVITILASSVPAQYILPEMLAGFSLLYPDISFMVKQADTLEVSRGIASQTAEVGFSGGVAESGKCEFTEFMTEQMVVIAPADKGFNNSKLYSLEELICGYRFISREKGSGTREQYETFFSGNGVDVKQVNAGICFDNTQSIINAVACGLGVSMVSEFAARAFILHKMVMPLKLEIKLPNRKFYYVKKKNFVHSHLVDLFTRFIAGFENTATRTTGL